MILPQSTDNCSTTETCGEEDYDYSDTGSCLSDQDSQSEEIPGLLVKGTNKEYADEEERDINEHSEYDNDLYKRASTSQSLLTDEDDAATEDNSYLNKFAGILKRSTGKYGACGSSTKHVTIKEATNLQEYLEVEKEWIESHGMFTGTFSEGQSTQNFVNQINGFYEEMNAKLKLLKNNSVLKRARENCDLYDLPDESGDFCLRDMDEGEGNVAHAQRAFRSPGYRSTYAAYFDEIGEMDSQLAETGSELAEARSERLRTQEELCSRLSSGVTGRRDKATQLFLDLCEFERSNEAERDGEADRETPVSRRKVENEGERQREGEGAEAAGRNFIRRNVELAKQGFMATCSLTDEEKHKLESLLGDIDEMIHEGEDNDRQLNKMGQQNQSDDDEEEEEEDNFSGNAFKMNQNDKSRLEEINEELKKLKLESCKTGQEKPESEDDKDKSGMNNNEALTQKLSKGVRNKNLTLADKSSLQEFMLEQNLKDVEKKLKEIEELYNKDEIVKQKLSEQRKMMEMNREEEDLEAELSEEFDAIAKEEQNEEIDRNNEVIGSNECVENVRDLTIQ